MENILANYVVIEEHETDPNSVRLGSKVKVLDLEFEEEESYQVVGSQEADPMNGRISEDSPFGKALLGNAVGEDVYKRQPLRGAPQRPADGPRGMLSQSSLHSGL